MRRLLVLLVVAACAAALAGSVRADGDPASDYLLSQQVFFPFTVKFPQSRQQQLAGLVKDANDKGFHIRVALINGPGDLGVVTALWKKPQPYAHFLGQEIKFLYRGRLLVVMPNGLGFNYPGHDTSHEQALMKRVPLAQGSDLITPALTAVQKLAAADGVTVTPAPVSSGGGHGTLIVILVAVAVILLAAALVFWLRRRHSNFSRTS
jgi:hypothetical protein